MVRNILAMMKGARGMAKSFIHHDVKNGILYASVYKPQRLNGKKDNAPEYLGRVIDEAKGIYRSRDRGVFTYSLENGYGDVVGPQNLFHE
jgi:hypothetical protein